MEGFEQVICSPHTVLFFFFFLIFLAASRGMWDLGSPTRD